MLCRFQYWRVPYLYVTIYNLQGLANHIYRGVATEKNLINIDMYCLRPLLNMILHLPRDQPHFDNIEYDNLLTIKRSPNEASDIISR